MFLSIAGLSISFYFLSYFFNQHIRTNIPIICCHYFKWFYSFLYVLCMLWLSSSSQHLLFGLIIKLWLVHTLIFFHVCILIYFIATILVLDLASILISHKQHLNIYNVLQLACSQAENSGVFTRILETISGTHGQYPLESSCAFMLQNRLIKPGCIFTFILIKICSHFLSD